MDLFSCVKQGEVFRFNDTIFIRGKRSISFNTNLFVNRSFEPDDIVEVVDAQFRYHRENTQFGEIRFQAMNVGDSFIWRQNICIRALLPDTAFDVKEGVFRFIDAYERVEPINATLIWAKEQ